MLDEVGFDCEVREFWRIPLESEEWVTRSHTAPNQVAALRKVLRDPSEAVRERFDVKPGLRAPVLQGGTRNYT